MRYLITAIALLFTTPALAGNHFILEFEGGMASPGGNVYQTENGGSVAASFGIGGALARRGPALYLIGRSGFSKFGFTGPPLAGSAHVDREQNEFGIGGRLYVPITQRMRLFGQVLLGNINDESIISREGFRPVYVRDDMFAVFTELGFQYRLSNHVSLGANVDFASVEEEVDLAALDAGVNDEDTGRMRFAVSTTFHF